jgi:hypothetical protein
MVGDSSTADRYQLGIVGSYFNYSLQSIEGILSPLLERAAVSFVKLWRNKYDIMIYKRGTFCYSPLTAAVTIYDHRIGDRDISFLIRPMTCSSNSIIYDGWASDLQVMRLKRIEKIYSLITLTILILLKFVMST